ncbi:MAG: hypothetical protein U0821_12200 [Chloroflexota bacterium]
MFHTRRARRLGFAALFALIVALGALGTYLEEIRSNVVNIARPQTFLQVATPVPALEPHALPDVQIGVN